MIIADDEQIILDGLSMSVDWKSYGIEVVSTATNGIEALEAVKQYEPDIMMTDIRMPGLSGIELIKRIKEISPSIKTILFSAFQEFQYAKEAITLEAMAYITKPLKKEDVIKEVLKAKERIYQERKKVEHRNKLEELHRKSLAVIRESFCNHIIMGKIPSMEMNGKQFDLYGIHMREKDIGVMTFQIDNFETFVKDSFDSTLYMVQIKMIEIINEVMASLDKIIFISYRNEIVMLYNAKEEYKLMIQTMIKKGEKIKVRIEERLSIKISIGMGRIYPQLKDVKNSYEESLKALNYRLIYGQNIVIYIEDVENHDSSSNHIFDDLNNTLLAVQNLLLIGDYDNISILIHEKASAIYQYKSVPYYYIQQVYCQLLSVLLRSLNEFDIQQDELLGIPTNLYDQLFKKSTYEELQQWYLDIVKRACKRISERKEECISHTVTLGIEYIKNNYDRDLSLTEVADYVGLNPSYFSRVFKIETGTTFVEYVRKVKIEAAMSMLQSSSKKVYEICEELGYNNVQYFSNIFKNAVGVTPNEYRKVNETYSKIDN